jgi:hypothetical protein
VQEGWKMDTRNSFGALSDGEVEEGEESGQVEVEKGNKKRKGKKKKKSETRSNVEQEAKDFEEEQEESLPEDTQTGFSLGSLIKGWGRLTSKKD